MYQVLSVIVVVLKKFNNTPSFESILIEDFQLLVSIVEIMGQLKLDHYGEPISIEWSFRSIVGLFRCAYLRSQTRDSNQVPISPALERLTIRSLGRHPRVNVQC